MSELRELHFTLTDKFVFDPERVARAYAWIYPDGFATAPDDKALEVFEALYQSNLFNDVFEGWSDEDHGYEFFDHDPEA